MRARILFLRWSLLLSLTVVGAVIAAYLGWFDTMYHYDVTKLSVVILGVFVYASARCGMLSWRVDKTRELVDRCSMEGRISLAQNRYVGAFAKSTANDAEGGWFNASLCEKLGLTGTVFGFVIMLIQGFGGFDSGNPEAMKQLLERLSTGMSTAFITTLVGVVCSILLSLQYRLLERALDRIHEIGDDLEQDLRRMRQEGEKRLRQEAAERQVNDET